MFSTLFSQLPFDGSMLAILAAFALTYWIGRTFLFAPVLDLLELRANEIEQAAAAYRTAQADVEAELETQRAAIAAERLAARAESDEIRREAQAAREQTVHETQRLTEEKLEVAGRELAQVVVHERAALEQKANQLADLMTRKVLRKAS